MEGLQNLELSTLCEGSAEILFQEALKEVLENLIDRNCDPKSQRSITLTFKFTPKTDREGFCNGATVRVEDYSVKLAKRIFFNDSEIALGRIDGELVAKEYKQMPLFDPQGEGKGEEKPKLKSIKGGE